MHILQGRFIQQVFDLTGVVVSEKEQPGSCEICQGNMRVQKTFQHKGRTIEHGTFDVIETVWVCAAGCRYPSGELVTRRASSVVEAIMPNSIAGYDVMVFVGLKRFLDHWQREEIRVELHETHGIELSSGEISKMSRRFLDYLVRLHHARAGQLKAAFESDGGFPMHVDATGENGRGTLLVVMAGWRKWVLGAWKIATEKSELILPCLQDVVGRFGAPCAAMRDLGRAVTPAIDDLVSELDIDIPVLACHQHFLADIGNDLLDPSHSGLRELFRRTKTRPKLRNLVRDLGRQLGEQIDEARKAVVTWQSMTGPEYRLPPGRDGLAVVRAMTQWTLDYKADATGLDFPFDRPYLDLYNRCITILRVSDAFLRIPPDDRKVSSAIGRLHRVLTTVSCEVPFLQVARQLHRRAALFDELRDKLRMATKLPENESEKDIDTMRNQFEKWVASLNKRRPKRGDSEDTCDAIDIILKHIDTHGINLWGHAICLPEDVGGGIRLAARTNEQVENLFRDMKHDERRRSGRKNLTQDLEHLPAAASLAYNLKHSDYVTIACGSLDQLPKAFALLDQEDQSRRRRGLPSNEFENLGRVLELSTASLPTPDRRIIRTDGMNQRINKAARSRVPRLKS